MRMHINTLRLFVFVLFAVMLLGCSRIQQILAKEGTVYTVQIVPGTTDKDAATERVVEVLKSRLGALKLNGSVSRAEGKPDIVTVKVFGKTDGGRVKKFLLTPNKLELRKMADRTFQTYPTEEAARTAIPENVEVLPLLEESSSSSKKSKKFVRIEKSVVIDGRDLRDANAFMSEGSGNYTIGFMLNSTGAQKFGDWTGANIGSYLAIVLDQKVLSVAVIRGQIFDAGSIDGRFDKESAEDLALSLKSGYLDADIKLLDELPLKE